MRYLILFLTIPMLMAFGSKHSTLESTVSKDKSNLQFQFKIKANSGMQLTHQAPWSVTIENAKNLGLEVNDKGQYVSKSYDDKLPGFTVKSQPSAQKGSFNYKVKAFVCTEDKKRCYPQTHKGTVDWEK